jgi:hypothetical protein
MRSRTRRPPAAALCAALLCALAGCGAGAGPRAASGPAGLIALLRLEVRPRGGGRAARARLARVDYVPTWVRRPDFRVLPVWRARVAGSAPRADLVASWRRTTSVAGRGRGWGPWREPRP